MQLFSLCRLSSILLKRCIVCGYQMVNGELQVLFECRGASNPENLLSMDIKFISNKGLVQEYLDEMQFIPHFKKIVTMEPTSGLRVV